MSIAERIKELRGTLSQAEFAAKLGVHKNSLGRYERGLSAPDSDFITQLCSGCMVSPYWLLFGEGPRSIHLPTDRFELRQKYSRLAIKNTKLKNELLTRSQKSIEICKLLPKVLDVNQPNLVRQFEDYFREMIALPDSVLEVDVMDNDPHLIEINDSSSSELI